jgi:hypothetical protein
MSVEDVRTFINDQLCEKWQKVVAMFFSALQRHLAEVTEGNQEIN